MALSLPSSTWVGWHSGVEPVPLMSSKSAAQAPAQIVSFENCAVAGAFRRSLINSLAAWIALASSAGVRATAGIVLTASETETTTIRQVHKETTLLSPLMVSLSSGFRGPAFTNAACSVTSGPSGAELQSAYFKEDIAIRHRF